MADFKTHLVGAALVSGVATTALLLADIVPNEELLVYFSLGAAGGLLPDIDSDTSIPIRVGFTVLAVVVGFLAVLSVGENWSLVELLLLWGGCYLGIRYGLFEVFTRLTVHRGLIHSIPAGVLCGQLTALIAFAGLEADPLQTWLAGSFVCMGFLVHLLLDEAYSVDLAGQTLKRSFGSAFNLGSRNNWWGTLILYAMIPALFWLLPPPDSFLQTLLDPDSYELISQRLLPSGAWFSP